MLSGTASHEYAERGRFVLHGIAQGFTCQVVAQARLGCGLAGFLGLLGFPDAVPSTLRSLICCPWGLALVSGWLRRKQPPSLGWHTHTRLILDLSHSVCILSLSPFPLASGQE